MRWIIAFAASFMLLTAHAMPSPEGVWRTIDDDTGEARSLVEIQVVNGELRGHIIEIIQSDLPEDEWYCTKCSGDKEGQPFVGLRILEEMTWSERHGDWRDGTITDPANGREYSARLSVMDDDQSLEVRGFVGFSLIGRTQTWERVE
ncbi:DUF2147 domain-containing protein [Natronospirillum operosum]|uniref:DUF2147 domain-containing protein n=1 Tax=Natronospirillum operosum TaxID=2759953 RepID=A0A4Z0W766_9GAMM|nr:DUF2147 domain-containing protein [Natronospirillum operosum]TGG93207.1 DUF2147 domain-containing protein [Natronospirillum operosum]